MIDSVIKMKNKSIISIDNTYKEIKSKHQYQILDVYWKEKTRNVKKISQKFC